MAAVAAINGLKTDIADTGSGSKGSALIGHVPPIGKFPRTVQDKLTDTVSVKDFGAIGNGIADDTAAIQAAVTFIGDHNGGEVYFPRGFYKITNEISIGQAYVNLRGAGRGATRIQIAGAAHIFHVYGGANVQEHFTCHGMTLESLRATPTGGSGIYLDDAPYSNIYNVAFRNLYNGIRVRSGFLSKIQDFDILDAVSTGILIQTANDVFVRNFSVRTTDPARHALSAVRIEDFAEAVVMETGEVVGGQRSLTMDASVNAPGTRPAYNRFKNIYFDSSQLKNTINNSVLCNFDSCWFSGARAGGGDSGLELQNTIAISFLNTTFFNNGTNGCRVTANSPRVNFQCCQFISNGVTTPAGSSGLGVDSNSSNFTVQNCTFANGMYVGNQAFGMFIGSGTSNNVTIVNNDFVNSGTVAPLQNGSTGTQQFIGNNRV